MQRPLLQPARTGLRRQPRATQLFFPRPRIIYFITARAASSRLFLQLFVIIAATSLAGTLFTKLGRTSRGGRNNNGYPLGPSLFSWLRRMRFGSLFAPFTLEPLRLFSQIGVCLFMFAVGMELDVSQLRRQAQTAILVSHSSIVIPYLLGVTLALFIYQSLPNPEPRSPHSPFLWAST